VSQQPQCYSPCGWYNTTFAVYSSPDLLNWTPLSFNIFPMMTDPKSKLNSTYVAYFEPCVLYNAKYDNYVLWFDHPNTKGTAVSSSPIGPFATASWDVGLPAGSDAYFWTDDATGHTYVKHNGQATPSLRYAHYVSQLNDEWDGILPGATSNAMLPPAVPIPPYYQGNWPDCTEGGGMFSYLKKWYVMAGTCCCFCAPGSNAWVWMSDAPLGPYTLTGDVIAWNATSKHYMTDSQQFSVTPIDTTSGTIPMYIGQRFGSATDGLKCHDFQYWYPIQFQADGTVKQIPFVDQFTLELKVKASPSL